MEPWIKNIKNRKFNKSLRGYDVLEVEAYLELIAEKVEKLQSEKDDLTAKLENYSNNLKQLEQEKQEFNKLQEETQIELKELKIRAEKEAKLIITDARLKADAIRKESFIEKNNIQQEIEELKLLRKSFITRFKHLLHQQLDTLTLYSKDN